MVLKNPYIFLIKHFKFIHLILTALFIYLTIKINELLGYYNNFIAGSASKLDAYKYMNNNCVIISIIAIIICCILYAVLRYKKKPRMLYIGLIAFLILIIVLNKIALNGLDVIYMSILDSKTLRLYRDLLQMLVICQYISIGIVLVRGLGFDIKKFNFVDDLVELNVDINDDEEVELMLGNSNTLKRKINRQIREFKYYYYENKLFIHIILGIVIIGLGATFFINKEVVNKIYEEGESFSDDSFTLAVNKSFITNKDKQGKIILDNDDTFVIVKMNVSPYNAHQVNTALLMLKINSNSYNSNSYYMDRFNDIGTVYKDNFIDKMSTYLFVYEIPKSETSKKMKLIYNNDKTINLKPIILDEIEKEKKYKLGEYLDLSSSILDSGGFKINSFEVKETFDYSYKYYVEEQEFERKRTISSSRGGILNIKLSDVSLPNGIDNYDFFNKYVKIKYKTDNEEKAVISIDNKTPKDYKEGLYLSVNKEIIDAKSIWLDITIRNKHYIYTLK